MSTVYLLLVANNSVSNFLKIVFEVLLLKTKYIWASLAKCLWTRSRKCTGWLFRRSLVRRRRPQKIFRRQSRDRPFSTTTVPTTTRPPPIGGNEVSLSSARPKSRNRRSWKWIELSRWQCYKRFFVTYCATECLLLVSLLLGNSHIYE